MQVDDVARLGVETHHIDTAAERLQVGVGAGGLAERIHHMECTLVAIEEGGLEARAAARFEMGLSGLHTGSYSREKVFSQYACAVGGLEAVAERGVHNMDCLFSHRLLLSF